MFPLWPELYGNISTDTVMLGESLQVEHHPFIELVHWQGYPHEYDAALGLAPQLTSWGHPDDSQPQLPSPFMGLMESKQLEKNSFALLLPYDRQDIGDLSFGTSHPEFHEGPLVSHQIHPTNASTWQVEAPGISMRYNNGTEIFNHSLSGLSARLDSIFPQAVAWLPEELAETIMNTVNATVDNKDCYVPQVPCDKISELPDLVFDFGSQEIVLKGEDYVGKAYWPLCFGGPYCTPLIGDIRALQPAVAEGTIVLGGQFLKKVYSVFDWDDRSVSCKSWTSNQYFHKLTGALSCNGQASLLGKDLNLFMSTRTEYNVSCIYWLIYLVYKPTTGPIINASHICPASITPLVCGRTSKAFAVARLPTLELLCMPVLFAINMPSSPTLTTTR